MKTIIAICLLISSVSFADKQSDKTATDSCFKILNSMIDDTNAASFSGNHSRAVLASRNFNIRKSACLSKKQDYESQWGKYEMPSGRVSLEEVRKLKEQEMGHLICLLKLNVIKAGTQSDFAEFKAKQLLYKANAEYHRMYYTNFKGSCESI